MRQTPTPAKGSRFSHRVVAGDRVRSWRCLCKTECSGGAISPKPLGVAASSACILCLASEPEDEEEAGSFRGSTLVPLAGDPGVSLAWFRDREVSEPGTLPSCSGEWGFHNSEDPSSPTGSIRDQSL